MRAVYGRGLSYALAVVAAGALLFTVSAFAQEVGGEEVAPEGEMAEEIEAALEDISALYGSPVVRVDQAKAICNQEQYLLACAEIGRKHGLFHDERAEQVDTLVEELKGDIAEKIAQCADVECLVLVADSLARRFNRAHPEVAEAVGLTPEDIEEKQGISEAAKELGVDFEQCRTMDPDTADVELLRACARLAKDERIRRHLSEEVREEADMADATIELKESLARGELQCGDGSVESCGDFCLNPSAESIEQGTSAIPPICREIAQRFFGPEGVQHLEEAYSAVQSTRRAVSLRQEVAFTTIDGRTLTSPEEIGRYLEEAGARGDIEAVSRGMDYLLGHGFITSAERDFALKMVTKIKERGSIDFDRCETDPESCQDFIPDENRADFGIMTAVEKIMRTEMASRGINDPRRCEFDPAISRACMDSAITALPQIRALGSDSPNVLAMIAHIEQKIRFGEEVFTTRQRAEERIQEGGFRVGDRTFTSMAELEAFCTENSSACLAEAARSGFISRDIAQERYRNVFDDHYEPYRPEDDRMGREFLPGATSSPQMRRPELDREAALHAFEAWLDNPIGPPPVPPMRRPAYGDENIIDGDWDPRRGPICPMAFYAACPEGQYRQEYETNYGCPSYGECIPITTKTQPKIGDKVICPAMPTVSSCSTSEERFITYSSPECGTYYGCRAVKAVDPSVTFPYTFNNGKKVASLEEARAYCLQYGPGSGQGIVGECEQRLGVVYPRPPEEDHRGDGRSYRGGMYYADAFVSCMAKLDSKEAAYKLQSWLDAGRIPPPWSELPSKAQGDVATCEREAGWKYDEYPDRAQCENKYGSGWHTVDQSGNCFNAGDTEYYTPGGVRKQCTDERIFGCSYKQETPQCSDGKDNDGNGRTDFPDDQGCYGKDDWSEGNFGDPMPQCMDERDNDNDGKIDYPNDTGCDSRGDWDEGYVSDWKPTAGQKEQIWNTYGLRSWIREDADSARITSLKNACANVHGSSGNIWMPGAGDSTSKDFGMPDPDKCAKASACTSEQYFDGTSCATGNVSSTPQCSDGKDNDSDGKTDYPDDTGCYGRDDWDEAYGSTAGGQGKNQIWNSYGLQSWIREDADTSRISALKSACADVRSSSANVWMGGAGTYSSPDFGMPDPEKCRKAAACTSSQYFNGTSCVEGSGQWNGNSSQVSGSCSSELLGLLGSGCHNMGNAWFDSGMIKYVMPGTTQVKSCSMSWTDGCSGGAGPSSYDTNTPEGCAAAGRAWDNSNAYCKPLPPPPTGVSSTSAAYQCAQSGGTWDSTNKYCNVPNSDTARQNCVSAGGTWDYSANYCKMPTATNTGSTSGTTVSSSTMRRCFYPNATRNGQYVGYTVWCESDYVNCHEGSPSSASVSTTGLSLGAPSSCESGWSSGSSSSSSCGPIATQSSCNSTPNCYWSNNACMSSSSYTSGSATCGSYSSMSTCVANSSCNWNTSGNYCTYNSTSSGSNYGSCGSYTSSSSCSGISGCMWSSSSNTCTYSSGSSSGSYEGPQGSSLCSDGSDNDSDGYTDSADPGCQTSTNYSNQSTSCPSGQWWDSSTQSCRSMQESCAQAGGTWDSSSNYCQMPGSSSNTTSSTSCGTGYYWNGSSCVPSGSSSGSSCASGQYWNGSSCVSSGSTDTASMQSGCASAGGTWNSTTNSCVMPTNNTTSYFCPTGHEWTGSHCTFASASVQKSNVASVIEAILSIFGW